jgi:HSP20 family protein
MQIKKEKTMANLTRWDPFADLLSLPDRLNQLLNQGTHVSRGKSTEQALTFANFIPPVDVMEDDNNIMVQVELPGVKDEDVEVRIENNMLTISGERKLENEEQRDNFLRVERAYGRFFRSFTLPSNIDPENVNATFDNGILKITIPKREESKPKQIKIESGSTNGAKSGSDSGTTSTQQQQKSAKDKEKAA